LVELYDGVAIEIYFGRRYALQIAHKNGIFSFSARHFGAPFRPGRIEKNGHVTIARAPSPIVRIANDFGTDVADDMRSFVWF
jgi:hypothetical protein